MKGETVSLRYQDSRSDKVYNITLREAGKDAWVVHFEYGRFGSSLNVGEKTPKPVSHGEAHKIFEKIIKEKIAKGYKNYGEGGTVCIPVESKQTQWLPQLLNECSEEDVQKYIDSDEWCAQMKYDGKNRLLIKSGDSVIGTNRKGLEVAIPIGVKDEMDIFKDSTVISGEAIGDDVYCFDLISEKGKSYLTRMQILYTMLSNPNLKNLKKVPTAWSKKEKQDLLAKLKKDNAEGIVFKNILAHYTPGRPASGGSQLKFKFCATASVLAGDINKGKRSVEMWVHDENGVRVNVGNVTIYPNQDIPKRGSILEVKYLYYFKGGSLFQPVLLGQGDCSRDDIDFKDCTIDQLKYKKKDL